MIAPVLRADFEIAVPTEQGHDMSCLQLGCFGRIQKELIHRDGTNLGEPTISMQGVDLSAQRAQNTIGIAQPHDRQSGWAFGDEAVAMPVPAGTVRMRLTRARTARAG